MGRRLAHELAAQRLGVIEACGWNLDAAARYLGIDPSAIRQWLARRGVRRPSPGKPGRPKARSAT